MAIVRWTTQSWSDFLDYVNTYVAAGEGVIVMMNPGSYSADVAADLSRFIFVGMAESATAFGGTPTTLTLKDDFTNLGNTLSSGLTRSYLGTFVPTIKLAASGVLNVSASQYSELGGGNDPTVEMGDGSILNVLLTAAGIVGDKTAVLKSGATAASATLAVDASCVVAGVNGAFGAAFGAGIDSTTDVSKNGNAFFGPYTPTTGTNWTTAPDNVGVALDQLAARVKALGG